MFLPSTITLQPGDSGDFVAELQRRLAVVDCFSADAISGFYDGLTTNAVSTFQSRTGIKSDGIAGPETLRRLNGVISGDSSATSGDKKEEEASKQAAAAHAFQMQTAVMDQQAAMLSPAAGELISEAARTDPTLSAAQPQTQPSYGPTPEQIAQQQQQQMLVRDQVALQTQQPSPPPQSASDILAQMLLQTANTPPQTQQQPPRTEEPPTPATPPTPEQPQPRSMMGRAVQFASEMMQKLAHYFESKLPASVLNEVRAIGNHMASHGVKEVPIPTEPTARTAELPGRGQEQAQTPRRT